MENSDTQAGQGAMVRDVVFVVEDDCSVRQSLRMLLGMLGVEVRSHANGRSFLDDPARKQASCVVLDLRMPGLSGLEVQRQLVEQGTPTPVIFITGHGDVSTAVEAMRTGAIDYLQKPFDGQMLLKRVQDAIVYGRNLRQQVERHNTAVERLATLSPREREVLELLVVGKMNKAIAAALGISVKTVEDHRSRILRKMQVRSVAELVHLVVDSQHPPFIADNPRRPQ